MYVPMRPMRDIGRDTPSLQVTRSCMLYLNESEGGHMAPSSGGFWLSFIGSPSCETLTLHAYLGPNKEISGAQFRHRSCRLRIRDRSGLIIPLA